MPFLAIAALIKVDVAAPARITLNVGEVLGAGKQVLVELTVNTDCSLGMTSKYLAGSPRAQQHALGHPELESAETIEKLSTACHSIPLLTYYALKRPLLAKRGQGTDDAGPVAAGEDCNGIAAVDDDLSVAIKMEGEDMLLDEMSMF